MITSCPACGSTELKTNTKEVSIPVPHGEPIKYEERIDTCLTCGEYGDFTGENESRIEEAIAFSKKQSVNSILDELSKRGIKMTYLERALELPQRTISRWKNGEFSASSIALLKTVVTFPWFLEVADAKFDQNFADMRTLIEANRIWCLKIMPHVQEASLNISGDTENVDFHAHVQFSADAFKPSIQDLSLIGA
jgi:hypothetical protein